MDGPPAQSLTFEGLLPSTMKEPPRDPNTPVIDRPMIGMRGRMGEERERERGEERGESGGEEVGRRCETTFQ